MDIKFYPHVDALDLGRELISKEIVPEDFSVLVDLLGSEAGNDSSQFFSLESPWQADLSDPAVKNALDYIKNEVKSQGLSSSGIFLDVSW